MLYTATHVLLFSVFFDQFQQGSDFLFVLLVKNSLEKNIGKALLIF